MSVIGFGIVCFHWESLCVSQPVERCNNSLRSLMRRISWQNILMGHSRKPLQNMSTAEVSRDVNNWDKVLNESLKVVIAKFLYSQKSFPNFTSRQCRRRVSFELCVLFQNLILFMNLLLNFTLIMVVKPTRIEPCLVQSFQFRIWCSPWYE